MLSLGFMVKYPFGSIAGNTGVASENYSAMNREAAEEYIRQEAERLQLKAGDFEILSLGEVKYVKGPSQERKG